MDLLLFRLKQHSPIAPYLPTSIQNMAGMIVLKRLGFTFVFFSAAFVLGCTHFGFEKAETPRVGLVEIGGRPLWFALLPFVAPPMMVLVFVFSEAIPVVAVMVREYEQLLTQISVVGAWLEDVACAMLWNDPLSEFVWWLAGSNVNS